MKIDANRQTKAAISKIFIICIKPWIGETFIHVHKDAGRVATSKLVLFQYDRRSYHVKKRYMMKIGVFLVKISKELKGSDS